MRPSRWSYSYRWPPHNLWGLRYAVRRRLRQSQATSSISGWSMSLPSSSAVSDLVSLVLDQLFHPVGKCRNCCLCHWKTNVPVLKYPSGVYRVFGCFFIFPIPLEDVRGRTSTVSPASPGPSSLPSEDMYFAFMFGNILPTLPTEEYHSSQG